MFSSGTALSPLDAVVALTISDVNGDGKPDIVDATDSNHIEIMINNGAGGFAPPMVVVPGGPIAGVAVGDLNGDGKVDLVAVTASPGSPGSNIQMLLGQAGGTFAAPVGLASTAFAALAIADMDGDGKLDVVSGSGVLFGHGDGAFSMSPTALRCDTVSIVDFNTDGKLDILCGPTIWLNQGDRSFSETLTQPNQGFEKVIAGDVNGDGKPDLILPHEDLTTRAISLQVALNQGNAVFDAPVEYPTNFKEGELVSVALGDVNGDGRPDLLLESGGSEIGVMLNAGTGTFSPEIDYFMGRPLFARGGNAQLVVAADMNGDGKVDIVATSGGTIRLLFNNGCR